MICLDIMIALGQWYLTSFGLYIVNFSSLSCNIPLSPTYEIIHLSTGMNSKNNYVISYSRKIKMGTENGPAARHFSQFLDGQLP